MKRRCKHFGSTANQSKRRKINGSPATRNLLKRSPTDTGGSRLQSLCSASKVRKVAEKLPIPQEIYADIQSSPEKGSQRAQTSIKDLPPEIMLEIFEYLNDKELYHSVAPVCKQWFELTKRPVLRRELAFSGHTAPTAKARGLIRSSPFLRKLPLKGRNDCDILLSNVLASNRDIKTIEIVSCKGSPRREQVRSDILCGIIQRCQKLCKLVVADTSVTSPDFYRVLAQHRERIKDVNITITSLEDALSLIDACDEYFLELNGSLNGELKKLMK
jgi:hypothetical protein